MRMNYQGTVDLRERVDGRMEAELLRDLPAIGFIISKVLWPVTKLFEYRITGTLGDPKTQPLYVLPKILLMPFHPIKTIKDLIPEDPGRPGTTAPAPIRAQNRIEFSGVFITLSGCDLVSFRALLVLALMSGVSSPCRHGPDYKGPPAVHRSSRGATVFLRASMTAMRIRRVFAAIPRIVPAWNFECNGRRRALPT